MRIVLVMLLLAVLWCPASGRAADMGTSELRWTAALIANAAYSGELNILTRKWLTSRGWQVLSEEVDNSLAAGRLHLFNISTPDGEELYFLAFPGTESVKDAHLDLRITRVPFGGSSPREFAEVAADLAHKTGAKPLVHRGFNEYVQTALFTRTWPAKGCTLGEALAAALKEDKARKLYLTGHSMGGATATLAAARLADLGVSPEQLEVITFGAPAVGNEAFARQYEHSFQLTRVSMAGDPVDSVLQSLTGGFVQFGQRVDWRSKLTERFPHGMAVFLDEAWRHYVDEQPAEAVPKLTGRPREQLTAPVYVAQPEFKLSGDIRRDKKYMERAVGDLLQATCSPQVQGDKNKDFGKIMAEAQRAGCTQIILTKYTGERIRQERYNFRLTLEEEIYDIQGNLLSLESRSTTTKELTPIEVVAYLYVQGQEDRQKILPPLMYTKTEQHKDSEK